MLRNALPRSLRSLLLHRSGQGRAETHTVRSLVGRAIRSWAATGLSLVRPQAPMEHCRVPRRRGASARWVRTTARTRRDSSWSKPNSGHASSRAAMLIARHRALGRSRERCPTGARGSASLRPRAAPATAVLPPLAKCSLPGRHHEVFAVLARRLRSPRWIAKMARVLESRTRCAQGRCLATACHRHPRVPSRYRAGDL